MIQQMKKIAKDRKLLLRRILEISFKHKLSHIGSCLSTIDILDSIYAIKSKDEPVVLSNGHAGVALYTILEKYESKDAEALYKKHGVHPNRNLKDGIYVSTGSLGQGLPIAVGMAIADKNKTVYCIISDGECAEGSIWESTRVAAEQKLSNLKILVNANGLGAYDEIDIKSLPDRFKSFGCKVIETNGHRVDKISKALTSRDRTKPLVIIAKTKVDHMPFLQGIDAHYMVMNESDYSLVLNKLKL